MKVVKITTPEYLSGDILDEDFVKSFLVQHQLQFFLGSCRVHSKDRFVTPVTNLQKVHTIFCILVTTVCIFLALTLQYTSNHFQKQPVNLYLDYGSFLILILPGICNFVHVRFFNCNKNVQFFVNLQKLDRLLKIDRMKLFHELIRLLFLICLAIIIGIGIILFIFVYNQEGLWGFFYWAPSYYMVTFSLEVTTSSSILIFFLLRIKYVNCLMINHLKQETVAKTKPTIYHQKAFIRYYAQETGNSFENSDTNIYLREIFKCFSTYQELYRFQLCVFCTQLVISTVFFFGLVLYAIRNNRDDTLVEIVRFCIQLLLNVTLSLALAVRYNLFFRELRKTKRLCINIMAKHTEGPLRKRARNMLKMIDETPPRFSVYEMWEMNPSTFVSMVGLITSFIVTILQFVFL